MRVPGPSRANQVLRGALLGCGHVAPFHLRAWACVEGAEIAALANRTVEKAYVLAREFSIPAEKVYSDYRDLLRQEELDFVDIATAPQVHRQQVEAAASHGKHVLCQEPFAPSLEDAYAMLDACEQAGVLFSINENWRWRRWYRSIKQLLDEGVIGRVRCLLSYLCARRPVVCSLVTAKPTAFSRWKCCGPVTRADTGSYIPIVGKGD